MDGSLYCVLCFSTVPLQTFNGTMQYEDAEPIVRIRELKKDRVNFILENVDLAYVVSFLNNGCPFMRKL